MRCSAAARARVPAHRRGSVRGPGRKGPPPRDPSPPSDDLASFLGPRSSSGCATVAPGRGFATTAPWKTRIRSVRRGCQSHPGRTLRGRARRRWARRNAAGLGETPRSSTKRRAARRNAAQLDERSADLAQSSLGTHRRRWTRRNVAQVDETWRELSKRPLELLKRRESCAKRPDAAQNRARAAQDSPGSTKHPQGARETARARKTAEILGKRRRRRPKDGLSVQIQAQRTTPDAPTVDWAPSWAHHGLETRPGVARALGCFAEVRSGLGPAVEFGAWISRRCARTASTRTGWLSESGTSRLCSA